MRQRLGGLAGDPHFRRLRVALVQIGDRLVIRTHLGAGIHSTRDHSRSLVAWHINTVDVVSPTLFNHRVNALRAWTPGITAYRKVPAGSRFDWLCDCLTG